MFGPLGVTAVGWLSAQSLALSDILAGFGLLAFIAVVCILIPEGTNKSRKTPYTFKSNGYYDRFQ